MANIVPFESAKPLARSEDSPFKVTLDGVGKGGVSFPVISYKGKVFHLKRGDDLTLITKPDDEDSPAPYIEGVIIGISPEKGKVARTFYSEGYKDGSDSKPMCSSLNGETPDADVLEAQASKCDICAQNVVGSGATEQNPKAKACKSHKRIAFAAADSLNDPMLLRVPGDSLGALAEYNKYVAAKGFPLQEVVTRVGFDHSKAHPALTFKAVGVINDTPTIYKIFEATKLDVTNAILGKEGFAAEEGSTVPSEEAPKVAAPAASKKVEKPAPAKVEDDDLPTTPKAKVKVEAEQEKPKAEKPAKVEKAVVVESDAGLDDALGDLDFDD